MAPCLLALALIVEPAVLDRITVSARRPESAAARPEAVAVIDGTEAARAAPTHPNELFARVPGAWISRGSGQEQLTAIRSPVLTGAGACGAFLVLEDGVPIRPAGFCNVNELFELDTVQLGALEVLRGPGAAVHGSNALHGVINVVPYAPGTASSAAWLEAGSDNYRRLRAAADGALGAASGRVEFTGVGAGSFRDQEGFDQQQLRAQSAWPGARGAPRLLLSASHLNQETAGFVSGRDAYRDDRRRRNENPEAYRDAQALRLQGRWEWALDTRRAFVLVPYARRDRQRFLQHFILGQPTEDNGSHSAGVQALWSWSGATPLRLGLDLEFARGELVEDQAQPLTDASPLQNAIRPEGRHYDYAADAVGLAGFGEVERALGARTVLLLGGRVETLRYAYDNRMSPGNLRADGTPCPAPGGCLFNRPDDRDDAFAGTAAQLGLRRELPGGWQAVGRLARAFRFPQAGELYRLQRGQDTADLEPETLDGLEFGLRRHGAVWELALDAYTYDKRHVILRDAQGFNVSDGRTTHRGVELGLRTGLGAGFALDANAAYAIQRYAFDRALSAGERIVDGNEVDTAPRWLGGLRLGRDGARAWWQLEAAYVGAYWLDAANSARYPGHLLWHARAGIEFGRGWSLQARVMNLADRRYAERADFAFGEYRYFPGAGRSLFLTLAYRLP